MSESEHIFWCFSPEDHNGPGVAGIWDSRQAAETWIRGVGASGVLSGYVLNKPAYDSIVERGWLNLDRGYGRRTPKFQSEFTTPIDHFHYENGEGDADE